MKRQRLPGSTKIKPTTDVYPAGRIKRTRPHIRPAIFPLTHACFSRFFYAPQSPRCAVIAPPTQPPLSFFVNGLYTYFIKMKGIVLQALLHNFFCEAF